MIRIYLLVFFALFSLPLLAQQVDLENIDTQLKEKLKKKPFSISGNASVSGVYNKASDNPANEPFLYFFNGNITLGFYDWTMPINYRYTNQGDALDYQIPFKFNRLSLHPKYKWILAHIGDVSMSFSPYTFNGLQFTGGGLELTPEKYPLKASFMVGQLAKATEYDGRPQTTPTYERWGYGTKLTYKKDDLEIDEQKHIGFDSNKTDILKLIEIFENDISIQDMGKGKENLIKTETSLSDNLFDIIFIDEPENHLSFTNTRKLVDLLKRRTTEQVILVSHSSLVVSRLDLNNVIWLSENGIHNLKDLRSETTNYFSKIDNLDILRFILAEKVILVEGAAEYIILPKIYIKELGNRIETDGVEIISMGSISYERYREVAESLNKKVAVITDNDKVIKAYENTDLFRIFSDSDVNNWTLEVAFYNSNVDFFDELYKDKKNESNYKGEEMKKSCAYMLKNKSDNALLLEKHIYELEIPNYLKEAVKWIKE